MHSNRILEENPTLASYLPPYLPEILPPHDQEDVQNLATKLLERSTGGIVLKNTWQEVTLEQLKEKIDQIANALISLGVKPADRVVLFIKQKIDFIPYWLATVKIGAIPVSVQPKTVEDLEFYVRDSFSWILVTDSPDPKYLQIESLRLLVTLDSCEHNDSIRCVHMKTIFQPPVESPTFVATAHTAAAIFYTSGTTGKPKGCVHTHSGFYHLAKSFASQLMLPFVQTGTQRLVFSSSSHPSFIYGLSVSLMVPLYAGGTSVLLDVDMRNLNGEQLIQILEKEEVTVFCSIPTVYNQVVKEFQNRGPIRLKSLQLCFSAGEHLPSPVFEEWKKIFGMEIIDTMGTSEVGVVLSNISGRAKPGSSGVPLKGIEVKLFDQDLNEVGDNIVGQLGVKGPVGCCYWNDPVNQMTYVRNGWNLTGDRFHRDAEGFYWFSGRTHDLIITKCGENASAIQLEDIMMKHPAVKDAAVIGIKDPKTTLTAIKAFVVAQPGSINDKLPEELMEFSRQRTPHEIGYIEFLDSLPQNRNGKKDRGALKART